MAFRVDLVSPERLLASVEADSAQIPGQTGEFTALPGHAPYMTTLRPGLLTIRGPKGAQEYVVTGGFAEISPDAAAILAEEAAPRAEVTRHWLEDRLKAAETAAAEAPEDSRTALAQRANDFRAVLGQLAL